MRTYHGRRIYSKEENYQLSYDIKQYYLSKYQETIEHDGCETPGCVLLDSSLISQTNLKQYSVKVIQCGDYYQVYNYNQVKLKTDPTQEKIVRTYGNVTSNLKNNTPTNDVTDFYDMDNPLYSFKKRDDVDWLFKPPRNSKRVGEDDPKKIELKNIQRSKFQLQRLVKSNEECFKTFITLTFADNITSIEDANKKFNIWRTKIKSVLKQQKKEFQYVCVPEFQKRGAVHYHLLTNLNNIENPEIIIPQDGSKCKYDVKYWSYGFSSVFSMNDINVVGYISKYMTKDIDDRLWGKRRYLYSQNLKKPSETYLDLSNIHDMQRLFKIFDTCDVTYDKIYCDHYAEVINFTEYKKKEGLICI